MVKVLGKMVNASSQLCSFMVEYGIL